MLFTQFYLKNAFIPVDMISSNSMTGAVLLSTFKIVMGSTHLNQNKTRGGDRIKYYDIY